MNNHSEKDGVQYAVKVLILTDLEGISGIVSENIQALPSSPQYQEARKHLMSDINGAVEGAFPGGATEVVVFDTHCDGLNIILEDLHEKAKAILGNPILIPEELVRSFDAKILIGYHSMAETPNAVLCHTYPLQVQSITLNGLRVGEIGIEMMTAAYLNVPTILVAGDSEACREARELVKNVETVDVKQSIGFRQALCDGLKVTRRKIRESTEKAVQKYKSFDLLQSERSYKVEISFYKKEFAQQVSRRFEYCRKELRERTVIAEDGNLFQLWNHLKDAIWANL